MTRPRPMTNAQYRAARVKLGLTQTKLAAKLGVTSRTIKARENAGRVTDEAALAIRSLLDKSKPEKP